MKFEQPTSPSKSNASKKSRVNGSILQKRFAEDQEPETEIQERKVPEVQPIEKEAIQPINIVEEQIGNKRRVVEQQISEPQPQF